MDCSVGACSEAIDKRFASLRRTTRKHNDFAATEVTQSNRFGKRAPIEGIHDVATPSLMRVFCVRVFELDLGDFGNLLDADDQPHLSNLAERLESTGRAQGNGIG